MRLSCYQQIRHMVLAWQRMKYLIKMQITPDVPVVILAAVNDCISGQQQNMLLTSFRLG